MRDFADAAHAILRRFAFLELEVEAEEANVRVHVAELVEFALFKPSDTRIFRRLLRQNVFSPFMLMLYSLTSFTFTKPSSWNHRLTSAGVKLQL